MPSSQGKPKLNTYTSLQFLKDIVSFVKPYKAGFIFSSLIRIVGDIAFLYPTYALATMVTFFTTYEVGQSFDEMKLVLILLFLSVIIRFVSGYYAKRIGFEISEKMTIDAELHTIAHLFKLNLSWHEHENTGNKLKRLTRGAGSLDKLMRLWIGDLLGIIVSFVAITFIFAKFDTTILLMTLFFMVTYYFLSLFYIRRASAASHEVNVKEENVEGLFFESLNNIRTVKVMAMADALGSLLQKETIELYSKIKDRIFWYQSGNMVKSIWAQGFRVIGLAVIVYGITQGVYEVGFLVIFYSYFGNITQAVSDLSDLTQDFVTSKLSLDRMMQINNEPVTIDNEKGKVAFPKDWKMISINNLSFAYGENYVLENLSFDIKRGEKVGIVGLSGAGKSTLFKLLLKEYENYRGNILIDNVPLNQISKKEYFAHATAVLQETEVFNFSLKENVVLANDNEATNDSLFDRAIHVSHTADFIPKLSQGVDTQIGEKGVKLSGGERQRLGLARAIFKNPEILFLDEATSHLDVESEEKIQSSLHEFFQSVTAIVIAHRLTTIKEMDKIVVIEGGTLVEEGSFDELYKKQGRFYELWEKQKLNQ